MAGDDKSVILGRQQELAIMTPNDLAADNNADESQSDMPQEITESYGTGVHPEPGFNIGNHNLRSEMSEYKYTSPELTGGDVDAAWEHAADLGDEAVGGTAVTPDQDVVDEIGKALGLEMDDQQSIRTNEILEERDDSRWELDPQSSEDYRERRD